MLMMGSSSLFYFLSFFLSYMNNLSIRWRMFSDVEAFLIEKVQA